MSFNAQDVDKVYNKPMSEIITSDTRMVISTFLDVSFAQDIFLTSAKNRAILRAINMQNEMRAKIPRREGFASCKSVLKLGPWIWSEALAQELFGPTLKKTWGDQPGYARLITARKLLEKEGPTVKTTIEKWCDGMAVTPFRGCKSVVRSKLYEKYLGGKDFHWTVQTYAKWGEGGGCSDNKNKKK